MIEVPIVEMPDTIHYFGFKKDSKNTLELCMNNGWSISFRIHNAKTKVENSLKFDVKFIGMPAVLIYNCTWI